MVSVGVLKNKDRFPQKILQHQGGERSEHEQLKGAKAWGKHAKFRRKSSRIITTNSITIFITNSMHRVFTLGLEERLLEKN